MMTSAIAQPLASNNIVTESSEIGTLSNDSRMRFSHEFVDAMPLTAAQDRVAAYLAQHRGWFVRCAQPMSVEPVETNAYILTIGKYGSFGYEIEPKVGLELLPPDEEGVYHIATIPLPEANTLNYDVDFRAEMRLKEIEVDGKIQTHIDWKLNLTTSIQFPKFITKLPKSLLQSTGDKILATIVSQVSRCLTKKVQADFAENFLG
jgi:hypothetical protein